MKEEKMVIEFTRHSFAETVLLTRLLWALPMILGGVLLCNPFDGLPVGVYGFVCWVVGAALVIWGLLIVYFTNSMSSNDYFEDYRIE